MASEAKENQLKVRPSTTKSSPVTDQQITYQVAPKAK